MTFRFDPCNGYSSPYFKTELKLKKIERDLINIEKNVKFSFGLLPLYRPSTTTFTEANKLKEYVHIAKENIKQVIRGLSIEQLNLLESKIDSISNNCFKTEIHRAKTRYIEQRNFLHLMQDDRHSYPL